jgi:hypothetical protein
LHPDAHALCAASLGGAADVDAPIGGEPASSTRVDALVEGGALVVLGALASTCAGSSESGGAAGGGGNELSRRAHAIAREPIATSTPTTALRIMSPT